MAALDEFEVSSTQITLAKVAGTPSQEYIRQLVAQHFWDWYDENKENVIVKISLFRGFIKHSVRLKDLSSLFVTLFGIR